MTREDGAPGSVAVPSDRFPRQGLPAVPDPKNAVQQKPGRELLDLCRHREADRGYDTARKHGLSALEGLEQLMLSHP